MTITIRKHEEGWEGDIQAGDQVQLLYNGTPLPETLVTVPLGYTARIILRYAINKDNTI